ncbi:hypothetical protein WJX72_005461 [[Myrmecia] bisecta]|uniref:TsaA-like domain-containing protein n=1 Tax=[Myrmecia] bisecta TaxID=41462 RepID=A0AAW1QFD8_9CHLO
MLRSAVLIAVIAASSAAVALLQLLDSRRSRNQLAKLKRHIQELQDACRTQRVEREAERAGRIRAEQALRQLRVASSSAPGPGSPGSKGPGSSWPAYPLRPIGTLRSCFTQRNGTPRQPLLVPQARARLTLRPGVPPSCLEGLEQYSHCWILYVFHCNTDLAKLWADPGAGSCSKGKTKVPRLNGGRMGVLATRSPHRPVPIGLSTATIEGVEGNTLLLGGADVVDGTPVLDIKPYLPFCDSIAVASAPHWVSAHAEDEPLESLGQVMRSELRAM